MWEAELGGDARPGERDAASFAEALRQRPAPTGSAFSPHSAACSRCLGATPEAQVDTLRESEHALYMVGDGRINLAGLNARNRRPRRKGNCRRIARLSPLIRF